MNEEYEANVPEDDSRKLQFYRKKEQNSEKKQKVSSKTLLFISVVAIMLALFIMSPFFRIESITVTDMERYSEAEILDMADIHEGDNILFFSSLLTASELEKNTYFEEVKIKRDFPHGVNIEIKERRVRGYVPYMGSYLYIDEYGRVLEISSGYTKQLPIVEGLEFDRFTIGEKIDADNYEAFNVMVIMAQMMTKYELLDNVLRIDVSDTENIIAYVKKIEVNLGDVSNSDQKIRTMGEIIKQIPEGDRGTLDLSDISKPIIFKYLT